MDMQQRVRLKMMDAALGRGLQAPGNDFIQRQALEEIIRNAFFISEPVLDYLVKKLQPEPAPVVIPALPGEFKCQHPECKNKPAFATQMALNGHMKKHASNP